ncbi:MAG: hypothetical protein HKN47_04595 [Pirellulaceae bacterium]|nr:hypothetical protein [Pirellulaceae bacterium]
MPVPDLFHAGFAKCASTFLQSVFQQRDDVFMVFKSEFISPLNQSSDLTESEHSYLARFDDARDDQLVVESDEHLILPVIHPALGVRAVRRQDTKTVLKRLHELSPRAKLLFIIRNRTDMILSTYSQYVLAGGTKKINAFVKELLSTTSEDENYYCVYYDEIIETAQEFFGDRVLVLLLEDLRRDQSGEIDRLNEFLQLPPFDYKDTFKARRIGLSVLAMHFTRMLNLVLVRAGRGRETQKFWVPKPVYKFACNMVRVIDHYVISKVLKLEKSSLLNYESKALIESTFAGDNMKLSRRLGRDLAPLGYVVEPSKRQVPALKHLATEHVAAPLADSVVPQE